MLNQVIIFVKLKERKKVLVMKINREKKVKVKEKILQVDLEKIMW